jgi:hypothetical protein
MPKLFTYRRRVILTYKALFSRPLNNEFLKRAIIGLMKGSQ